MLASPSANGLPARIRLVVNLTVLFVTQLSGTGSALRVSDEPASAVRISRSHCFSDADERGSFSVESVIRYRPGNTLRPIRINDGQLLREAGQCCGFRRVRGDRLGNKLGPIRVGNGQPWDWPRR